MKEKAEYLREKLNQGELVVGGHAFFTDPAVTSLLGYHGFETVWIDAEHCAFTLPVILQHIMAASDAGTASLVRIAWNDQVIAKPVLEMGPDGIIFPYVRTAQEARDAVACCTYPPKGIRGFGPRRAQKYGAFSVDEYLEQADRSILKILQIEHCDAIDQLDEIAEVEGIDLLVVGPNDLSASYGLLGKTRDPRMMEVYDHVAEVCKAHKMPFGVSLGAGDLESAREWLDRGIAFLSCGDDISYMDMGCRMTFDFVDKYKQEKGG